MELLTFGCGGRLNRHTVIAPHYKRFVSWGSVVALFLVLATGFGLVDMSGDAEPSRLETRLSLWLLETKIRLNDPPQDSPLTSGDEDLKRSSEI